MKFYAEPNLYVRVTKPSLKNGRKSGFYFDENGVFETEDPRLIDAMKLQFSTEPPAVVVEEKKTRSKKGAE